MSKTNLPQLDTVHRELSKTPHFSSLQQFFTECWILFKIQFSIIRDQWVWVFLMASMFPFTTLLFLKFFTVDPTPEVMIRIITGNMLFGLIIMGLNAMAQEISWQKHQGHFTFYASLPISKINFVFANLLRGVMTSLPSVFILAAVGQWVYQIQFNYSWGLIPILFLSVFSVVGFGVLMGFWSPNHQLTNMLAQALMMIISFLTPIMVGMDQLPQVLKWFSYLFPTTYAAEAFRTVLIVGWTQAVTYHVLVLLGFTLLSFWLIMKKMNWRIEH
jgi:ABC-2 type transport system permease protein